MGHEIRRMAAKKNEDISVKKKKLKSKKTVIMQNMSEDIVT